MRIALFLSSVKLNTGYGGHYRSLLSYKKILEDNQHVVEVYHYSKIESSIIDEHSVQESLKINNLSLFASFYSKRIKNDVDCVISFSDSLSSNIVRYLCHKYNKKYIQVIPGGKSRKIPLFFNNCIYFSEENADNKRDFSRNKILLSNRVDEFDCNEKLIQELEMDYPKRDMNIIRISKISKKYYVAFDRAIQFHKFLLKHNLDVQTHLVGLVEDVPTLERIRQDILNLEGIYLITSEKYSRDAKLILNYYEVAIGVGRGFWEAVSKGLFVFGISKNSALPILVDANNYDDIRRLNFSTRYQEEEQTAALENMVNNFNELKGDYKRFQMDKFLNDYSTKSLPSKLNSIIDSSRKDNLGFIFLSFTFSLVSSFIHIFNSSYKNS